jgi:diguanylate cyclase (GGDEF)-like protein
VALSLLTVAILVVLLMRDAMRRREFEQQIVLTNQELTDSVQALEDSAYQTRLLTSCSDELQLCVAVEQTYDSAADYLSRLLPSSSGSLCMLDPTTNMVEVVSYWGRTALVLGETFALEACCGLRLGQLRWRRPGVSEIECTHFPATVPSRYFCVPMAAHGDTLGLLCVECVDDAACTLVEQRMKKLRQLLQITAMAIASLNLRKKLENQAIRDALTGVFNRHFMEVVLHRELAVASRRQGSLAVFMIDVDHFKQFNDSFGHSAGDAMLKAIADVFQVNVRTEDTVCRYGGEEFAIILPGISQEVAQLRAELIRHAVTRLRVGLPSGMMGEATVSIGIALFSDEAPTVEALLFKADQALYRAKNNGRNQVALPEMLTAA